MAEQRRLDLHSPALSLRVVDDYCYERDERFFHLEQVREGKRVREERRLPVDVWMRRYDW